MEWIKRTLEEAENLADHEIAEISEKQTKDEIVVGSNIPTELKKLKTVINQKHIEIMLMVRRHNKRHQDPDYDGSLCSTFKRKIRNKIRKIQILDDIFWLEVEKAISYHQKDPDKTLGLRRGWNVVELDRPEESEIGAIIIGTGFSPFNMAPISMN